MVIRELLEGLARQKQGLQGLVRQIEEMEERVLSCCQGTKKEGKACRGGKKKTGSPATLSLGAFTEPTAQRAAG